MDNGRAPGGRQNKTEVKKVLIKEAKKRDILLGKHKEAFNHPGNRSFRTLIGANWERYEGARGRSERTQIVVSIVKFLKEDQQVRFLKKDLDSNLWFEVHDSVAREKVGHAIRDAINFRKSHQNGRPGSKRGCGSSDTASIKDAVQGLRINETTRFHEGSNKRPSPRTIKRQSKRAAKASTIATLGPPLLEDSPITTKPVMSSISGSSADDDSDEAIKMDVAGILGALKRGTSGSSVTFAHTTYSTNQLKVSDPPLSSIPLSSPQPRSSLLSKSIVTSTVPSSIRTPELMSQIAPSKSVDSADSNGDIEIMLADPAGNHPHDSGSEQQAMLTAFTVWAAQNNIPTSKN